MTQPLPYERDFDFEGHQSSHPDTPIPANWIDQELDQIAYTFDQVLARIADLQRDDRQLHNKTVGWDQLRDELRHGFSTPTVWATAQSYAVGNAVYVGRRVYLALKAHTSGVFNVDLLAGDWYLIADFTAVTQVDQTAADAAAAAQAFAQAASDSSGNAATAAGQAATSESNAATSEANAAVSAAEAVATLASAVKKDQNLADLPSAATARTNLGLGSAATADTTDFATAAEGSLASTALQPSDAPSDPDLSNDTDKLALRGDVDANLVLQYAADDTALKALDIASRKAAFNLANEGWWLPTTDDISAQITAADPRYLPTLDDATGAGGGFYQAGAVGAGSPFANVAVNGKTSQIHRLNDRLLIGDGAVGYNGKSSAQADGAAWPLDMHVDYLLINAVTASVGSGYVDAATAASGSIGLFGAGRLNGNAAGGAIGVAGIGKNDGSSSSAHGWGGYFETQRYDGAGFSSGVEAEGVNYAVSPNGNAGAKPYALVAGEVSALRLGSGGGDTDGTLFTIDSAAAIQANPSQFGAGIVFYDGALYRDGGGTTGRAHLIRMPANHAIEQYGSANVLAASLAFNVSDATHRQELRIDDNGLSLFNADGKRMVRSLWAASAVNGVEMVAAATTVPVVIRAVSDDDTDVGIAIRPRGGANGFLQTGAGASQFRWNGTGFAFGGAAPIARPDYTAASGTATRTTFDTASVTLPQLAERVKAIIDDNLSYGLYQ